MPRKPAPVLSAAFFVFPSMKYAPPHSADLCDFAIRLLLPLDPSFFLYFRPFLLNPSEQEFLKATADVVRSLSPLRLISPFTHHCLQQIDWDFAAFQLSIYTPEVSSAVRTYTLLSRCVHAFRRLNSPLSRAERLLENLARE